MNLRLILIPLLTSVVVASATAALAQDKGSVDPQPLPPLANPNDPKLGAKLLFGRQGAAGLDADPGDRISTPMAVLPARKRCR